MPMLPFSHYNYFFFFALFHDLLTKREINKFLLSLRCMKFYFWMLTIVLYGGLFEIEAILKVVMMLGIVRAHMYLTYMLPYLQAVMQ